MDPHLVSEIEKHNCVIFAGAGISTEGKNAHAHSLYDELRQATECAAELPFPELVDAFQSRPNGKQQFIELVNRRFAYIDAFRDLRDEATRFHRVLSGAPYFGTIITTNWDRYFEECLGATPFVYDSDIPFWDSVKRPVLKIHGSIDNYSSLVASSEDYKICEARLREGALGAVLKQIFATKTCIFCGYAANDPDFLSIYRTVMSGLGQFSRTHYIVSPFISDEKSEELGRDLSIISIRTNASYFLEVIRNHMEEKFCYAKEFSYYVIGEVVESLLLIHGNFVDAFDPPQEPHLIMATGYQDGLIHAFYRILDRKHAGEHADLHGVRGQIGLYGDRIAAYIRKRDYWNAAYFTGYQAGLLYFDIVNTCEPEEALMVPFFHHPGIGEIDEDEYNERVRQKPEVHKGALAQAKRITGDMPLNSGIIVQHNPFG